MEKGEIDFMGMQQLIYKSWVSKIHCLQQIQRVLLKYTAFNAIQYLWKIITTYSADNNLLITAEAELEDLRRNAKYNIKGSCLVFLSSFTVLNSTKVSHERLGFSLFPDISNAIKLLSIIKSFCNVVYQTNLKQLLSSCLFWKFVTSILGLKKHLNFLCVSLCLLIEFIAVLSFSTNPALKNILCLKAK